MSTTHEDRSRVVTKTLLYAVAIAVAIAFGPRGANAQATLTAPQGALYLACIGAETVGNLPTNIPPNFYAGAILTNQNVVSQSQSIVSLQGMSFVQLGQLMTKSIKTYASKQLNCTKKCTSQVLSTFQTQNQASCLAIASGFAP
jgi:hypothetical protein